MFVRFLVVSMMILSLPAHAQPNAPTGQQSPETPLIAANNYQVTIGEVMHYLEYAAKRADMTVAELTADNVSQGIIDLYAMKVLEDDAKDLELLPADYESWLSSHITSLERVKVFLDWKVSEMMKATDWEAEAEYYYLGNRDQFFVKESVTLRTLLLRTKERSQEEAVALASSIRADEMSEAAFKELVLEYTEDEVARRSGGLMAGVVRGQTVPSFEEVAFSLEPGKVSEPVISRFGVHLIQVIEKQPESLQPFSDAQESIEASLKRTRMIEYREQLTSEAKGREPDGYVIDEDAIDAFMNSLGHAKRSPPPT